MNAGTALILLILKGNALYFAINGPSTAPIGSDDNQTYVMRLVPVFYPGTEPPLFDKEGHSATESSIPDSNAESPERILAYGKETNGPHIYAVTAHDINLFIKPSATGISGSSQLHIRAKLRFYIRRTMDWDSWQKFSHTTERPPFWSVFQNRSLETKDADTGSNSIPAPVGDIPPPVHAPPLDQHDYNIGSIDIVIEKDSPGKPIFLFGEPWIHATRKARQVHGSEPQRLDIEWATLAESERSAIVNRISDQFERENRIVFSGSNILLRRRQSDKKSYSFFLGDYSFRRYSRPILAVDAHPKHHVMALLQIDDNDHRPFATIRMLSDDDKASSYETNIRIPIRSTTEPEKGMIPAWVRWFPDTKLYLIKVDTVTYLFDYRGTILYNSEIGTSVPDWAIDPKLPENQGKLIFTSRDVDNASPRDESLVFLKIFIDKSEAGRTEPSIGSRVKTFRLVLPIGRHLLRAERWVLEGNEYKRAKRLLQPYPIFIDIESGKNLWVELLYKKGRKPELHIKSLL